MSPTPQSRVRHHRLDDGAITADGVDERHTVFTPFEFEQQTDFVVHRVVKQVEGDTMRVGTKHAGNGFACGVQDTPVEPRPCRDSCFDVEGHVRVIGQGHRHARSMTQ